MRLLPTLLAAALAAAPALAQEADLLTPGHDALAVGELTFEDQTFEVRNAGQPAGTITQTATTSGDYVTIVTRTDLPSLQQLSTDSVRVLRASLAPQALVVTGRNGAPAAVTFNALRATGTYGPAGRTLPIDLSLKTPAFHGGTSAVSGGGALVARALPFREGYTARIETFSPTQRLREATLTVSGRESVERLDGSTVSAWVVEEETSGRGAVPRRYYVDPETRDLLQVTTNPPQGAGLVIRPADPEALAAEAAARAATPQVRPGDSALDVSRIRTGERTSTLNLLQPMAQAGIGTQTRTVTVDEAAGTVTVLTVVRVPMQNLVQTDSLVAAWPSLRPISQAYDTGFGTITLDYGDDRVTGQVNVGESQEVDVALEGGPVFSASALDLVLQALPLADGYRASVQTFAAGGGLTPIDVTVSTTEGDSSTYTVVAAPQGAPPSTYTISAETGEILRTEASPQQGVALEIVPGE